MTLDGGFKANGTQNLDPWDQYGPNSSLDKFIGPHFPQIHHPTSPRMLESEVNMLGVKVSKTFVGKAVCGQGGFMYGWKWGLWGQPYSQLYTREKGLGLWREGGIRADQSKPPPIISY